jgi:hypothetical protein
MCPSTGPVTYGKRESGHNRGFVALDTAHKGEEFSDARGTHGFPPALKGCVAKIKLIWWSQGNEWEKDKS